MPEANRGATPHSAVGNLCHAPPPAIPSAPRNRESARAAARGLLPETLEIVEMCPPHGVPKLSASSDRVLVVDSDDDIRGVIEDLLVDYGYLVSHASSADEATAWLQSDSFSAVVFHFALLQGTGGGLAQTLRAVRPQTRVIAMTASGRIPTQLEIDARLAKPFTRAELLEALAAQGRSRTPRV